MSNDGNTAEPELGRLTPGTTPTLSIALDLDVSGWDAALLTVQHGGRTLLERDTAELELSADGKTVTARLTQSETLRLPNDAHLEAQLRVLMDGAAMATAVLPIETARLLGRKELTADET